MDLEKRVEEARHSQEPRTPDSVVEKETVPPDHEVAADPDHTDGHPVARVVTAQDWNGPNDPENPQNWSLWKKTYHIAPTGLFAFVVTAGTSIYTPAVPEIMAQFHVSQTAAILGLSLYTLGLAFGPVIAAPISETQGRNIVYLVTLPLSMLFTLGAGFSQSFGSLLVCRLLAGLTGSPVLAVAFGSIADMIPPQKRALLMSGVLVAPFFGPSLGPVIGGFAAYYKGWRWTQWCILFMALPAYLTQLPCRETYKKVLLRRRAKKLGIPGPPRQPLPAFLKTIITITLARPLHMMVAEPIVTFLSLYTGFTFSILFAFFAAYPIVFKGQYGFNTWQTGLAFLGVGLGVLVSFATCYLTDYYIYQPIYRRLVTESSSSTKPVHVAPEHRLYAAMMGSFGIPVGLFIFAWTAEYKLHWIAPIIAAVPFAWGNLNIFNASAMYLADVYGAQYGASAMAANGMVRYTMGAVFPLFTVQMYTRLGIGWATSLLGFLSILMLPIPFVFFKFGPSIRRKSHYETAKF